MKLPNSARAVVAAVPIALFLSATAMAAPRAVYTETNDAAGNAVEVFGRSADGSLTHEDTIATGALGTGAGLGSQGAVALSESGTTLLAVNAGSDSVTSLRVDEDGGEVVDTVASGGDRPNSVTIRKGRAYVLNAGSNTIRGYTVGSDGGLDVLPGSDAALLPGAAVASQISFSPDGSSLVVTVRGVNRLDVFPLDENGRPGVPVSTPSAGSAPFGFAFTRTGTLVVSEAAASTASSYRLGQGSGLDLVTGSAATFQGAACWVAVTPNGRFAYTGNAAGSITGFAVGEDGTLTRLDDDGLTAVAPRPNDLATSRNGRYLYVINPRDGVISSYAIAADGSLERLADATLPATGNAGVAAR